MSVRGWIYDRTMRKLTKDWYQHVLHELPRGAHLLDVGIGTGGALAENAELLRKKNIRVTGVDIDEDYVKRARKRMKKQHLTDLVEVRLESILDHTGGPYDAAYFSASFMLMPDPVAVLRHVITLLGPEGRVFFTQTFNEKRSRFMEWAKPKLHKITTMHFGRVTYESDFRRTVAEGGLELVDMRELNRFGMQSYRLAVGRPRERQAGEKAEYSRAS